MSAQPCRLCRHFKRKGQTNGYDGFCWSAHQEFPPMPVNEHDSCDQWTPKVVEVKP